MDRCRSTTASHALASLSASTYLAFLNSSGGRQNVDRASRLPRLCHVMMRDERSNAKLRGRLWGNRRADAGGAARGV
eukprot:1204913-Pyramimonas_sp.AAC.1